MERYKFDKKVTRYFKLVTFSALLVTACGGIGMDTTIPTNTIQVPNTTGTVTDSGSVYTGLLGAISGYHTGQLNCECCPIDHPRGWNACSTDRGPCVGGGGEVQVMSIESRGQADACWLAATSTHLNLKLSLLI